MAKMILLRSQVTIEATVIVGDDDTTEKAISEFARLNNVPVENVTAVSSIDVEERTDAGQGIKFLQRVEKKKPHNPTKPETQTSTQV